MTQTNPNSTIYKSRNNFQTWSTFENMENWPQVDLHDGVGVDLDEIFWPKILQNKDYGQ